VLELPNQHPQATHIRIPDAEAARALCEKAAFESATTEEFLANHQVMASKNLHMKKIRINLRQKE
jgi:hypothetical protein